MESVRGTGLFVDLAAIQENTGSRPRFDAELLQRKAERKDHTVKNFWQTPKAQQPLWCGTSDIARPRKARTNPWFGLCQESRRRPAKRLKSRAVVKP